MILILILMLIAMYVRMYCMDERKQNCKKSTITNKGKRNPQKRN